MKYFLVFFFLRRVARNVDTNGRYFCEESLFKALVKNECLALSHTCDGSEAFFRCYMPTKFEHRKYFVWDNKRITLDIRWKPGKYCCEFQEILTLLALKTRKLRYIPRKPTIYNHFWSFISRKLKVFLRIISRYCQKYKINHKSWKISHQFGKVMTQWNSQEVPPSAQFSTTSASDFIVSPYRECLMNSFCLLNSSTCLALISLSSN